MNKIKIKIIIYNILLSIILIATPVLALTMQGTSKEIKDFLKNNLYLGFEAPEIDSILADNLLPDTHNSYDIGSYTYAWQDIFASGTLFVGDTGTTSSIYSGLEVSVLNVTTSTATSTFANGMQLTDGCYLMPNGDCAGAGGAGANTALSNLAAVAINTSLLSDTANTDDLGSFALPWRDIYSSGTSYLGSASTTQIAPWLNNTYDLGNYDTAWQNFYSSGTIYSNGLMSNNYLEVYDGTSSSTLTPDFWRMGGSATNASGTFYISQDGSLRTSGTIYVAEGSAVNPSIVFKEPNTGFYLFSTGRMMAVTGGLSTFLFDDAANYSYGPLYPNTNNTKNLGAFNVAWQNIYASNTLYSTSVSSTIYDAVDGSTEAVTTFTSDFFRLNASTTNVSGASGTLYLDNNGDIYSSGTLIIAGTATNTFSGGIESTHLSSSAGLSIIGGVILPNNSITDDMVVNTITASNYLPLAGGTITGDLVVQGNTDIGTDSADTLTINAYIDSSIGFTGNNARDIGISDFVPRTIYASTSIYIGDTWATSTIINGLEVGVLNVTTSTATSTFANGIVLNDGAFQGNLVGSANTAIALATDPTDCVANQYANGIATNGNLSCSAIGDADVPDTITASNYLLLTGGTITGNLTIGNETSDTLTITARLAADLDPSANNTYDLGAYDLAFKDIYTSGTLFIGSASTTQITPWLNNTYDLGSYEAAWRNIYSSSSLFIGTGTGLATSTFYDGVLLATDGGNVGVGTSSPASNFTIAKTINYGSKTQIMAAADSITPDVSMVYVEGNGGAVTITSTPSIRSGVDGQILIVIGTHDTNTVSFQDEQWLAGSGVETDSATNCLLGDGDSCMFIFNADLNDWVQFPSLFITNE